MRFAGNRAHHPVPARPFALASGRAATPGPARRKLAHRKRVGAAAALAALALSLGAPPADASAARHGRPRESYVAVDAVHVLKVGRPTARQVVVLVPGMYGAAGDFRVLARDLARRLPDTQVWSVDRREQSLADLSGFQGADPASYYLDGRYRRPPHMPAEARNWGLATTLGDLRAVVRSASDRGRRRVVLGGHSWGATTALAYAAWDFDGRPGYRDLSGLMLIDGGVHGAFAGRGGSRGTHPIRSGPAWPPSTPRRERGNR